MLVPYPETLTLREARKIYFDANGFGESGGYDDAWVDFKLGPIPMPFPNSKSRVKAVRYHDLHHLLTGYDTDTIGEFEIAGWEIAAGCKGFAAAWVLNLGGMAGGLFSAPRRVFAAFVRGRHQRTTYGENLDELLDLTVGEARQRFTKRTDSSSSKATLADVILYLLATVLGIIVGLIFFALTLPLVPIGLLTHAMRRRAMTTTSSS